MKAIRLHCNSSQVPRRVYLFADEADIPLAYPNCYVFKGVDWTKYPEIKERVTANGEKIEDYPLTAIPFGISPAPKGHYTPLRKAIAGLATTAYQLPEFRKLVEAILPTANTMSMYLDGVRYQSPCMMCHDFMKHVYGVCDIIPSHRKHCHFSLAFASAKVGKPFRKEPTLAVTEP